MPVTNRNGTAEPGSFAKSPNPRLATAATSAPAAKSFGPEMTSGAPITARPIAPTAKPSWTTTVRNGSSRVPTVHSSRRIGATAAAANDGDIARTIPTPRIASCGQRAAGSFSSARLTSGPSGGGCRRRTFPVRTTVPSARRATQRSVVIGLSARASITSASAVTVSPMNTGAG